MNTTRSSLTAGIGSLLWGTTFLWTLVAGAEPVVHWIFDVTDGEVRDVAGECHGKLEGNAATDLVRPGIYGNAIFFDTGKNRVRFPHSSDISLHDEFTVEYVIKPFRVDGFRTILWKGNRKATPEAINYYLDLRDGRPELKTKDANGRWIVYSTPVVLQTNDWHHVVFAFFRGKVEIFVNGQTSKVQISELGERSSGLLENEHDAILGDGANSVGSAYSFCGLIDDLRIYQGRELDMLAEDYPERWRRLRQDCLEREDKFEREHLRKAAGARRELERDYDILVATNASRPNAPFVATVLPSTERLNGSPDFFHNIRRFSRTAVCSAARREYEGFQIIVMGHRGAEPIAVSLSVTDLDHEESTARIDAANVTWGRIQRITTEQPDVPVDFVGPIPDVIIEDGSPVTAPPGDFGAVYCRVYTGDAPPGRYRLPMR